MGSRCRGAAVLTHEREGVYWFSFLGMIELCA